MSHRGAGWLAAAGACALTSLGLPWDAFVPGVAVPARVLVVLAAVLALAALRTGRDGFLSLAVLAGGGGVLLGGPSPTPGRVALAVAVGCLVLGLRARRRMPVS